MSAPTSNPNDTTQQPSMISGHLKYVPGAVSSALGYESGETTKKDAVSEMREANKQSEGGPPMQSGILGSLESAAGSLTGCEGMVNEGETRKGTGTGSGEIGGQTG